MKNRSSFIICSAVIIISNILLLSFFNNGEEIVSNLFVIVVTFFLLPIFLSAVDSNKTSLVRLESSALLIMASLSLLRLVNRIDTMPVMLNNIMTLVVLGIGILLIAVSIVRIYKNREK